LSLRAGMRRREFLSALGGAAAAWPLPAVAQAAPLRVGSASPLPRSMSFIRVFETRMRELGYVEGQNLVVDFIELQGQPDYHAAMRQLVERKADVIIAWGPEDAIKGASAATTTAPIVMAAVDYDPIALGYIKSLARPTGNVTGIVL